MIKDTSCTSRPCAWLSPNMVNVNYALDIDFSTLIAKRKKIMEDKVSHSQSFDSFVPSPSED